MHRRYATPKIADTWSMKLYPFSVQLCDLLSLEYRWDVFELPPVQQKVKLALETMLGGKYMNREEMCITYWEQQRLLCNGVKPKAGDRHFDPKPLDPTRVQVINEKLLAVANQDTEVLSAAEAQTLALGGGESTELVQFRNPLMLQRRELATQKVGILTEILDQELKKIERQLKEGSHKGYYFVSSTDEYAGNTFEEFDGIMTQIRRTNPALSNKLCGMCSRLKGKQDYKGMLLHLTLPATSTANHSVDGATALGHEEDPVYTMELTSTVDTATSSVPENDEINEALKTGHVGEFYSTIIDLGSFDGIVKGDRTEDQLLAILMTSDLRMKSVM